MTILQSGFPVPGAIAAQSPTHGAPTIVGYLGELREDLDGNLWLNTAPSTWEQVNGGGGGGGSINRITSSNLTVTNPTGPTVDIEVPGSTYDAFGAAATAQSNAEAFATGAAAAAQAASLPATDDLSTIAAANATLAAWSNNSKKITSLANGTGAQDAAAFGQIPVPANGYGVTGNTGLTPTPAVGLSVITNSLAANTAIVAASQTTLITLTGLVIGTYLIDAVGLFQSVAGSASNVDFALTSVGSATIASSAGAVAGTLHQPALAADLQVAQIKLSFVVVISGGGTVTIQAQASVTAVFTALAASSVNGIAGATSGRAVRIS